MLSYGSSLIKAKDNAAMLMWAVLLGKKQLGFFLLRLAHGGWRAFLYTFEKKVPPENKVRFFAGLFPEFATIIY